MPSNDAALVGLDRCNLGDVVEVSTIPTNWGRLVGADLYRCLTA